MSGRRLSAEARATLGIHFLYQWGNALSAVFLQLYLWRLTEDLWVSGVYNLVMLLATPLVTAFVGKIAVRTDRLLPYRAGIWLTAAFYVAVWAIGDRVADVYAAMAFWKGTANACYWLGHFVLLYDVVGEEGRHRYLGLQSSLTQAAGFTGPALAGAWLGAVGDSVGYAGLFLFSSVLFMAAVALSFRLRRSRAQAAGSGWAELLRFSRNVPALRTAWGSWFLAGLPQGIMTYLPTLLLYEAFESEAAVGYVNALLVAITILSGSWFGRIGRPDRTRTYLAVSGAGFAAASAALVAGGATTWPVLAFLALVSVFKPVQANTMTAHYYALVGRSGAARRFRTEAVVVREAAVNLGRSAGVAAFLGWADTPQDPAWPWIVGATFACQALLALWTDNPDKGADRDGGS